LAHLYSIGEHAKLSQPVKVSLAKVFAKGGLKLRSADAMSLTANQGIEEMDARQFDWNTTDVTGGKVTAEINSMGAPLEKRFPFDKGTFSVTLRPMEVRTFLVRF